MYACSEIDEANGGGFIDGDRVHLKALGIPGEAIDLAVSVESVMDLDYSDLLVFVNTIVDRMSAYGPLT